MTAPEVKCEVLVIGAGVSGISAGLAAARCGLDTVLVEKHNFLGGIGYSGLLQHICGLYLNSISPPEETLNDGLAREIAGELSAFSGKTTTKTGQVYMLPYNREDLRSVLESLCKKEEKLRILYGAKAIKVLRKGDRVTSVKVDQKGDAKTIKTEVLIDCSGSGNVSYMAGAEYQISSPEELQLAGYIVRIRGIKNVDDMLPVKVPYYLKEATEKKILPESFRFTVFSPGDKPDEGYLKTSIDINDAESRNSINRNCSALLEYLKKKIPSFRDTIIDGSSLEVMAREEKRICGEYTLTEDDVLGGRKFTDGVVKNAWPIEIWDKNKGPVYKYLDPGEYYEIPFRCLKAKGISNLLCAGRCISATASALGSARVMGTCISTGEQAGLAAAHLIKKGSYPYPV